MVSSDNVGVVARSKRILSGERVGYRWPDADLYRRFEKRIRENLDPVSVRWVKAHTTEADLEAGLIQFLDAFWCLVLWRGSGFT